MAAFRVKLGASDLNCVDVPLNPHSPFSINLNFWLTGLLSCNYSRLVWVHRGEFFSVGALPNNTVNADG